MSVAARMDELRVQALAGMRIVHSEDGDDTVFAAEDAARSGARPVALGERDARVLALLVGRWT
ncbi:hypothetical protein [Streptomyces sp. NBC_00582]|uniref:hypothetical protein n=1 Tax=Streptomyces sp. NBC_00582 TaxID=2975783 RepID=UPI002E7FCABD|nr:hypothetical protein [Streptomyces sp. NBC_00582]WUB68348.1 hypothetical protein OG852_49450 [Streptomyces sp. NBC_00582]